MLTLNGGVRENGAWVKSLRVSEEVTHVSEADTAGVKYIGNGDILNQVSISGFPVVIENSKPN